MSDRNQLLEERKFKLKEHIYKCAMRLIDKKGYRGVTLSEIAREAGVSTSTLYRYFPTKDDIILEFGCNRIHRREKWFELLPEDMNTDEALTDLLCICMEDVQENKEMSKFSIYAAYKSEPLHKARVQQNKGLAKVYEDVLKRGIERGELPEDTDCYKLSYLFIFNFFGSLDKFFWDTDPGEWSMREYLLYTKDTILRGAGYRPGFKQRNA